MVDIPVAFGISKADTTTNRYMQELPEPVQQMMGSVYGINSPTARGKTKLRQIAIKRNQTGSPEER